MAIDPTLCEQCAVVGKSAPADYIYHSAEASLAGPMLGDPDAWTPDVSGQKFLYQEHYARLPADSRLDYIPAEDNNDENHFGQSGEMGRTPT